MQLVANNGTPAASAVTSHTRCGEVKWKMNLRPEVKLTYKQFSVTCFNADDTMKPDEVSRILYAIAGEPYEELGNLLLGASLRIYNATRRKSGESETFRTPSAARFQVAPR